MNTYKYSWRDLGVVKRQVMVPDNKTTGELMREARKQQRVTLREMARRLKWSAPYVSDLELGRRTWTQAKAERYRDALFRYNQPTA
jgi:predicted transcriptional regulator